MKMTFSLTLTLLITSFLAQAMDHSSASLTPAYPAISSSGISATAPTQLPFTFTQSWDSRDEQAADEQAAMELFQLKSILENLPKATINKTFSGYSQRYLDSLFLKAVDDEHVGIIKFLISFGANINTSRADSTASCKEETGLHIAACHGKTEVARLLIQAGANLEKTYQGETALHIAIRNGHEDIFDLLYEAGSNINAKNKDNRSVLYVATQHGRPGMLKKLLQTNALMDLHIQDRNGLAPIHAAVIARKVEVLKALLDAGADINMDSKKGTPLYIAAGGDNTGRSCVTELVSRGADETITCNGKTPLEIAQEKDRKTNIRALETALKLRANSFNPKRKISANDPSKMRTNPGNNREEVSLSGPVVSSSSQSQPSIAQLPVPSIATQKPIGSSSSTLRDSAKYYNNL